MVGPSCAVFETENPLAGQDEETDTPMIPKQAFLPVPQYYRHFNKLLTFENFMV
jgi:hypothetical protein